MQLGDEVGQMQHPNLAGMKFFESFYLKDEAEEYFARNRRGPTGSNLPEG
jgi:hypothetical protein